MLECDGEVSCDSEEKKIWSTLFPLSLSLLGEIYGNGIGVEVEEWLWWCIKKDEVYSVCVGDERRVRWVSVGTAWLSTVWTCLAPTLTLYCQCCSLKNVNHSPIHLTSPRVPPFPSPLSSCSSFSSTPLLSSSSHSSSVGVGPLI